MSIRPNVIWISVAVVLCLALLTAVALIFNRPSYNWHTSFRFDDTDPYGTKMLYELLDSTEYSVELIEDSAAMGEMMQHADKALYLCIAENFYVYYEDIDSLKSFIHRGNTVFLSLQNMPSFTTGFTGRYQDSTDVCSDSIIQLNIPGDPDAPPLELQYWNEDGPAPYLWHSLPLADADDASILATDGRGRPVMASFRYGRGLLVLHSIPLAFTNWSVRNASGLTYLEATLTAMPDAKVYFDHYAALPYKSPLDNSDKEQVKESPLQYILTQQALRWAYYLLMAMLLIFLLFRSSRRQRAIPLRHPPANSAVDYLETIARMYRKSGKHNHIIRLKERYFRNFVNERYYIQNPEDAAALKVLALKSRINIEDLETLLRRFKSAHSSVNLSDQYLLQLHKELDHFYKNCL